MMLLVDLSILQMLVLFLAAVLISTLLYQRYFSPISDIPGPLLASFGTCWQLLQIFKGRISDVTVDLHKKHGNAAPSGRILTPVLIILRYLSPLELQ